MDERFELMMSTLDPGFWEWSRASASVDADARCAQFLGLDEGRSSWRIKTLLGLVHPNDLDALTAAWQHMQDSNTPGFDLTLRARHVEGHWVHLRLLGRAEGRNGEGTRFRGLCLDSGLQAEAFRRMGGQPRAEASFIANMNHSLRTPLNAILGLSESLCDGSSGELTSIQARSVQTIHRSGQRLLGVVNDLLDVARVDAGRLPLEMTAVRLADVLQECAEAVSGSLAEKSQTLDTYMHDPEVVVHADPRRLRQCVTHLLENAGTHCPAGAQVQLRSATLADGKVEITIADDGPGIPAEQQARVFEPFAHADDALNRKGHGVGLGLPLVKRLMELQDGSVSLRSEAQGGTVLTLVLESLSSGDALPKPSVEELPLVLLAEDDERNVLTYTQYLGAKGFRVEVAPTGPDAVRAAQTLSPDLILMDLRLPGLSGLDATRRIRASERERGGVRTPIVILTGEATFGTKSESLDAGVDLFLTKPMSLAALVKSIRALVKRSRDV